MACPWTPFKMPEDLFISDSSAVHRNGRALVFKELLCLNVFLNAAEGSRGTKSFLRKARIMGPVGGWRYHDRKAWQRHCMVFWSLLLLKWARDCRSCPDRLPSREDTPVGLGLAQVPLCSLKGSMRWKGVWRWTCPWEAVRAGGKCLLPGDKL